jgi:hypothetical protein
LEVDMSGRVGDRIIVESERAAQAGRQGVIEEVLAEDPPRYRVRWDDGRETVLSPEAGAAQTVVRKKRQTTRT